MRRSYPVFYPRSLFKPDRHQWLLSSYVSIPHARLVEMLIYKGLMKGIKGMPRR
ncbi:MAG: hypothetical protein QNJ41_16110 [Xenococcaceae cyanobacterium MO_188.B32]|nr:hypothetical protein [Xenococcaceae cyanobacterium MO_188.B32]